MDTFSIEKLRDKCNEYLDDDKKSWPDSVSDDTKDMYDLLCTAILVFLDREGYTQLSIPDNAEIKEWIDVLSILNVDLSRRGKNDKIRRLMAKYNITRK